MYAFPSLSSDGRQITVTVTDRREFDVSHDGQRFLFMEPATSRTEIDVISNWFDELRARVPTGR